jgi:hypothetical protein
MQHYVQLKTGKVVPCSWVAYELLKRHGWEHRLLDKEVAVLFKRKHMKKSWTSRLKNSKNSGVNTLTILP